jgi:hypothetical protein
MFHKNKVLTDHDALDAWLRQQARKNTPAVAMDLTPYLRLMKQELIKNSNRNQSF